jgi:hypothetical protein
MREVADGFLENRSEPRTRRGPVTVGYALRGGTRIPWGASGRQHQSDRSLLSITALGPGREPLPAPLNSSAPAGGQNPGRAELLRATLTGSGVESIFAK